MNSANLNNLNIVNSIENFNDRAFITKKSKNNIVMNIVSCEYSCDEQCKCFMRLVPGV
jgi:hypothetical protein